MYMYNIVESRRCVIARSFLSFWQKLLEIKQTKKKRRKEKTNKKNYNGSVVINDMQKVWEKKRNENGFDDGRQVLRVFVLLTRCILRLLIFFFSLWFMNANRSFVFLVVTNLHTLGLKLLEKNSLRLNTERWTRTNILA